MESGINKDHLNELKSIVEEHKDVFEKRGIAKILFVYNDDYPEDGYLSETNFYGPGEFPTTISPSKPPFDLIFELQNTVESAVEEMSFAQGGGGEIAITVADQAITHTWYENSRIDHPAETF